MCQLSILCQDAFFSLDAFYVSLFVRNITRNEKLYLNLIGFELRRIQSHQKTFLQHFKFERRPLQILFNILSPPTFPELRWSISTAENHHINKTGKISSNDHSSTHVVLKVISIWFRLTTPTCHDEVYNNVINIINW